MTSVYPDDLDVFETDIANNTLAKDTHPEHHNNLADAVNKIEAELGLSPRGSKADVKARLDAMRSGGEGWLLATPTAPQWLIDNADELLTGTAADDIKANQAFVSLPSGGGSITIAGRMAPSAPLMIFLDNTALRSLSVGHPTGGSNYRAAAVTGGGLIRPASNFKGDAVVYVAPIGHNGHGTGSLDGALSFYTTLTGNPTAGDATVSVATTAGLESQGWVIINGVYVKYTGLTSTTLTGCVGVPDAVAGTIIYKSGNVYTYTTAFGTSGQATLDVASVKGLSFGSSTTLDGALTAGATTINVIDASSLSPKGTVLIGSTYVTYTGKTATSITGVPSSGLGSAPSASSGATVTKVNTVTLNNANTKNGDLVRYTGISGNTLTGIPTSGVGAIAAPFRPGQRVNYGPGGGGNDNTTASGRTLYGVTVTDIAIDGAGIATPYTDTSALFFAASRSVLERFKLTRFRRHLLTIDGCGGPVTGTLGAWNNKIRSFELVQCGGNAINLWGASDIAFDDGYILGRIDANYGEYGIFSEAPGTQWSNMHVVECNRETYYGIGRQFEVSNWRTQGSYGSSMVFFGQAGLDITLKGIELRDTSKGTGGTPAGAFAHIRIRASVDIDGDLNTINGSLGIDANFNGVLSGAQPDYLLYVDEPAATTLDGALSGAEGTLTVVATAGFPLKGEVMIDTDAGGGFSGVIVPYNDKTSTTLIGVPATTLSSDVISGATSILVASTAKFPNQGVVYLGGDPVYYNWKSANAFLECVGTPAAVTGAAIGMTPPAASGNAVKFNAGTAKGVQLGNCPVGYEATAGKAFNTDDFYLPTGGGHKLMVDDRVVTKSGNYTLTHRDRTVIVTGTATITLPTAVGVIGKRYTVIERGGTATWATTSSQTIDGTTPGAITDKSTVISDGANWVSV